ncbi:hypothetical protein PROFUN_12549 [Planoprotostelium fungivorum]|uniref:DUF676 domain-containing protein n=1 Tax=Planoprotostelium fungivorum TaxID=1890364 RepID=A0A2P6N762_9EUKA|nr:hypothetical protein PROFUN_12549 [Planoprotostelium fungivorum]
MAETPPPHKSRHRSSDGTWHGFHPKIIPTYKERVEKLILAAQRGDVEKANRLVHKKKISPNCQGISGETPLMIAAATGQYDFAKYMIENGALLDISIEGKNAYDFAKASQHSNRDRLMELLYLPPNTPPRSPEPHTRSPQDDAEELNRKAIEAYHEDKTDESIRLYTKAIEKVDNDYQLYCNRAAGHLKAGNFKRARKDAQHSLELKPGYLPAIVRYVQGTAQLGMTEDALHIVDQSLTLYPGEPVLIDLRTKLLDHQVDDLSETTKSWDIAPKHSRRKSDNSDLFSTLPPPRDNRDGVKRLSAVYDIHQVSSVGSVTRGNRPERRGKEGESEGKKEEEKKKKMFTFPRGRRHRKTKSQPEIEDWNEHHSTNSYDEFYSGNLQRGLSTDGVNRSQDSVSSMDSDKSAHSDHVEQPLASTSLLGQAVVVDADGKSEEISQPPKAEEEAKEKEGIVDCVHFNSQKFWLPALELNGHKPSLPIVLCHGLLGFNKLGPVSYWKGIKQDLERQGCKVVVMSVPPTGSIETRAKHLLRNMRKIIEQMEAENSGESNYDPETQIDYVEKSERLGAGGVPNPSSDHGEASSTVPKKRINKVHIIGHSMAGLDCRYLISMLGGHKWIQSLTTLATPHHGSSVADRFTSTIGVDSLLKVMKAVGIPTEAFYQLSPRWLQTEFNPFVLDHPDVLYFSMSGGGGKHPVPSMSLMRLYYKYMKKVEGPNDGLVSIASAKWGEFLGALELDHMDIINWNPWRNTKYIYRNIAYLMATKEKMLGIQ